MERSIVMVGDNILGPGGIASVVRTYRDIGFFDRANVIYLSNYDSPGVRRQLSVMVRTCLAILAMWLNNQVALLHVHAASRGSFWRAAIIGWLARLIRIPYVVHVHSGEFIVFFEKECGRLGKALVRSTLCRSAGVICVTPGWKSKLATIAPDGQYACLPNPVVVPEGVPPRVDARSPRLLFLGRLTEKKGLFDLFQAIPSVLAKFPDLILVVAGDGDRGRAEQAARDLGIENSVVFEGWIDGVRKDSCLREASVVVLPSHFEAFGVAILDAMACGVPVVATRVGGIPEVMVDGVHGYLVPPRDPVTLSARLIALLGDKEGRSRMGMAGYHHVRSNYSAQQVTRSLTEFYVALSSSVER
ncbi:Glycosyltransferase involved in cell wall bisynthesis [Aromatoleum tolulyticum]|uniref:Glycosyltransferase involved in cell wall bisynthesis n=1 Tax=Aromatoleum tolulyticum TaxID=34027 RepID=A0A1N6PF32_9RHOO|nr:glycosyltransferase family 4 protein [Aromatoleum tolulyticum]SIQ02978.1 Glycosyltransferase involved in cell wall bisynthesis [Aromatoleum tolulyticum]